MSAAGPYAHHHHPLQTGGRALDRVALSATLHCLTGCAIGEILGLAIGTAIGLSNWPTVGLAVVLAFVFGYSLTSLPLIRSGLAVAAVVPIALASDTLSIATMEVVDNAFILLIPRAMDGGLDTLHLLGQPGCRSRRRRSGRLPRESLADRSREGSRRRPPHRSPRRPADEARRRNGGRGCRLRRRCSDRRGRWLRRRSHGRG